MKQLTPQEAAVLAKIKHLMPMLPSHFLAGSGLFESLTDPEHKVIASLLADAFNATHSEPPADVQEAAEKWAMEASKEIFPNKSVDVGSDAFSSEMVLYRIASMKGYLAGRSDRPAPDLSELREKYIAEKLETQGADRSFWETQFNWFDVLSVSGSIYPLTATSYYGLMSNPQCGDKPLLTPLAKMSEEDARELVRLSGLMFQTKFTISDRESDCLGVKYLSSNQSMGPKYTSYDFHYIYYNALNTSQHDFLDRKGYDQRNLIPQGLAIDKTLKQGE